MMSPYFPGISTAHLSALRILVTSLEATRIQWAVTGSLGFALQGVPVTVHDIDLQTDKQGAYAIERTFSGFSARKVVYSPKERIRSYYGALEVEGVEVEIMGDLQKRLESGAWEEPVDIEGWKRWVSVDDLLVPVMDLGYEHEAYLRMGRVERAELLRSWLEGQSRDNARPVGD